MEENRKSFQTNMNEIQQEDKEKVKNVLRAAKTVVGIGVLVGKIPPKTPMPTTVFAVVAAGILRML